MKTDKQTKTKIGHEFSSLTYNKYFPSIPLSEIFQIIKNHGGLVIDESGQEWSGFLCGSSGHCVFDVNGIKTSGLNLTWYKMESGRYEITVYLM